MNKLYEIVKGDIRKWEIQYRVHATKRMFQRDIDEEDVIEILLSGDIIEQYPDDFPFPSVLINGQSLTGRPIHIVVGIEILEKRLYIITVYQPDTKKWTDNFSRRLQ
ncbi:MAG: DUF4258 domain-containing protein [bacterium]|nr:DUF4258 domain-containing protein [bacterium]